MLSNELIKFFRRDPKPLPAISKGGNCPSVHFCPCGSFSECVNLFVMFDSLFATLLP